MAKKLTSIFLVVTADGIEHNCKTYNLAREKAEELFNYQDKGSWILEVVNAWSVDVPEEPAPQVTTVNLEDV